MNDVNLAHPGPDQLTAFAQGRLGEAELAQVHAHLSECTECQRKVEATGDDTLVALLRSADTKTNTAKPDDAATIAAAKPAVPDLPEELAQHSRYRVQELLGVGGMGAVYKAEHLLMERPVALKLISHTLTSDRGMIERFRREVKTAGQLKHPNIVMAYDAEQAGDSHFLVMEYVEGKSLARVVAERGPLPVREACEYIHQAALGLQYAHERGMVHRDIKPQNLMLTPDGQVKILDFGLARFAMEAAPTGALLATPQAAEAAGSLTQVGIVMGTPDYIAPEQAKDAHTADIRADIYSLGCTLYDFLAGHAPFADGKTVATKVKAHMERTAPPLNQLRSDMPPELARVVERMMAKDPRQRYQTPAEVTAALERITSPVRRSLGRRAASITAAVVCAIALGIVGSFCSTSIYRIVTDQGELVVEVDDAQVEVALKNTKIIVRDLAAKREYTVSVGRKDLNAGDYQLEVQDAGGMQVFTRQFTITRNGTTPVKITLRHVAGGEAKQRPADQVAIQGTWRGVSAKVNGEAMPNEIAQLFKPSLTFAGTKVTWKADPATKEAKLLLGAILSRPSFEGLFHLDPTQTPKAFDVMLLGDAPKKALLGIYRLQGDTLEVCVAVDPERVADRPREFDSKAGRFVAHIILKRAPAEEQPAQMSNPKPGAKVDVAKRFTQDDKPISDRAKPDQGGWRIDSDNRDTLPLFVVQDVHDDNCIIIYRAQLKFAGLNGTAYPQMLVHLSGEPDYREYFEHSLTTPISGLTDWASYETSFRFEKGQRPDRLRLNLMIEASGTVWIRNVELLRGPLVK